MDQPWQHVGQGRFGAGCFYVSAAAITTHGMQCGKTLPWASPIALWNKQGANRQQCGATQGSLKIASHQQCTVCRVQATRRLGCDQTPGSTPVCVQSVADLGLGARDAAAGRRRQHRDFGAGSSDCRLWLLRNRLRRQLVDRVHHTLLDEVAAERTRPQDVLHDRTQVAAKCAASM